jgi:hypothetical protein
MAGLASSFTVYSDTLVLGENSAVQKLVTGKKKKGVERINFCKAILHVSRKAF